MEINVTVTGQNPSDVLSKLKIAVAAWEGGEAVPTTKSAKAAPAKKGKVAAVETVEVEEEELADELEADTEVEAEDDLSSFDDEVEEEEEIEEEPAPKKSAKGKKITDKDVNDAAMKHAKKHGRKVTLDLLAKKFKVKTISELKPDTYAKVLEVLKV